MLIFTVNHLGKRSTKASPLPNPTSLRRPPAASIMSESKLISYFEGMKKRFWHERRHLHHDEIKLQWAAKAAPYTSILLDTEAPTLPFELTSTQGTQMACQPSSKSWAEAPVRRRGSVRTYLDLPAFLLHGADAGVGYRRFCQTRATLPR